MIAGTSGRIETKTARDHDRRPECLTTELRHNGQNGRIAPLRFLPLPVEGSMPTPPQSGLPEG
jgi:hypothetical protein